MEKKYKNKIAFLIHVIFLPIALQASFGYQGFIASDDYRNQVQSPQSTQNQNQNQNQNCPPCTQSSGNSSNIYIPPFTVQILDGSQKILNNNGKSLTINNSSSAVLIVQIFPASNNTPSSSSSVTLVAGETNHLVMYTVKDLLGATVLVDYDLIQAIPYFINIPSVQAVNSQNSTSSQTEVTPQAGINATNGTSAVIISLFGSNNTSLANPTAMTILNGLSPLTQKFIINSSDGQNFNITPISGSTDSEVSQVSTIPGVSSLNNLSISFNDAQQTTLFTFAGKNLSFDDKLQKGVILNVIIYPASSNNSYQVVASLRSSDGSKYRKQYALVSNIPNSISPLTSLPSNIILSYSGTTSSTSTRNFFNLNTASNNSSLFNFVAPISLQFRFTSLT